MNVAANSDRLDFNQAELKKATDMLRSVKSENEKLLTNYLDYVDNTLRPAWQTPGGQDSVTRLNNFGWNDIKSFIDYVDEQIKNLEHVNEKELNVIKDA